MVELKPELGTQEETVATQGAGSASTEAIGKATTECDEGRQFEFLYKALEDSQSTIRHLDVKAAFGIALLSAMIEKTLTGLGAYIPWHGQLVWREGLFVAFLICSILSITVVARIIFPVNNPAQNVSVSAPTALSFYIHNFHPRRWLRFFSTKPSFSKLSLGESELASAVQAASTDALLIVLTAEVLKVSYIRQIKMDRLKAFGWLLAASAALFAGLMVANAVSPQQPAVLPVVLQPPITITASPTPQQQQPNPQQVTPSKAHARPRATQ
jgi:hypothetical protein